MSQTWLLAGDEEIALMIAVIGVAVAAALVFAFWIVVDGRRKTRIAELKAEAADNEARLKALMLQRGMNADEIERILSAGDATAELRSEPIGDEHARNPEARIVQVLADNGYGGEDIERVLRTARVDGAIPATAVRTVETLAGNWAKAGDIERVLRTQGGHGAPA
jgi:hypothetical protein